MQVLLAQQAELGCLRKRRNEEERFAQYTVMADESFSRADYDFWKYKACHGNAYGFVK